jgi:hypothetical protein
MLCEKPMNHDVKDLSTEAFSEQCNALIDLYDYAYPKPPRIGRRRNIVVTDDWPDVVPTTEEEFREKSSASSRRISETCSMKSSARRSEPARMQNQATGANRPKPKLLEWPSRRGPETGASKERRSM